MPRLTGVGENTLQRAEQVNSRDALAQFFLHFPGNGFNASLTKFNAAADRAKERLLLFVVVERVDQNLSLMMKNAQGEGANARR